MTSPLSFFNRPGTYPYQLQNQMWPILQGQALNPLSTMAYQMQRQHAYSYGMAPSYLQPSLPPLNFSSSIVRPNLLPNLHAQVLNFEQKRETFNNKIQKTERSGRVVNVIEISDDSDVVELKKNDWPNPAPPAQMTAVISTLNPKKIVQQISLKQHQQKKIEARQLKEIRLKDNQRTSKTRKIAKKVASSSKPSEVIRLSPPTHSSRIFISERIIKKVKSQKEGFRLSKREREMLEITLLRDHANQIMTGPLFQARMPPFCLPNTKFSRQLNEKRENLLGRLYVDEQ